jgi:hypothetical protein
MTDTNNSDRRKKIMRRTFLAGVSGFVVTGCIGGNGDGEDGGGEEGEGDGPQRSEDLGPVPEEYENATAVGGLEREDPENLLSYDAVSYQSSPNGDQQCDGCMYWIPDQNDDGLGACAIVEKDIEPDGWCSRYAPQR